MSRRTDDLVGIEIPVWEYLKDNPGIGASSIAKALDMKTTKVQNVLMRIYHHGHAHRDSKGYRARDRKHEDYIQSLIARKSWIKRA